jgi:hypothetical protein
MVPDAVVSNPRGRREDVHRRARWTAQPGEHAMSSRAQHYREAERLREALPPDKRGRHAGDEGSGADAGGGPGARHAGHRAR